MPRYFLSPRLFTLCQLGLAKFKYAQAARLTGDGPFNGPGNKLSGEKLSMTKFVVQYHNGTEWVNDESHSYNCYSLGEAIFVARIWGDGRVVRKSRVVVGNPNLAKPLTSFVGEVSFSVPYHDFFCDSTEAAQSLISAAKKL